MGGRTLDQFRSIQRQKEAKKAKETDSPKVPKKEESVPPNVGDDAWLPS
ncbi:hypothetical protein [Sporomusa acidovorans]|uniref:Uncharacterized protein n=1 Tax=Sporomusa acidovorans (strain ATCC 49682 / DSM 3132 / Mol) TaxID=1123286 RepID=A0ABZ3J1H9_SPOA4|nr:hypothetical protein [Sporomusa acidovorans]OZC15012.1 hypothetical protein SPACI_51270 [Sporomusa acidovorans DSM 3132]SDE84009.1 hypothetical protein SAMN04488499_102346 [Sporomusa acidovorans]